MLELSEIKKELQAKEDLVQVLQSEAHKLQYVVSSNKPAQCEERLDVSPLTL